MTALAPYLHFPGTTRSALTFYQGVFGGEVILNTLADFSREDGPPDAIAHGMLRGPVTLFGADAVGEEKPVAAEGLMFALLGAAEPEVLTSWFTGLASGGEIVDDLQKRPWGAYDGQVRDQFGLLWLIGYEEE